MERDITRGGGGARRRKRVRGLTIAAPCLGDGGRKREESDVRNMSR